MSNVTFTREELEAKTVKSLKDMCVNELAIPGMTKKAKGLVITAILNEYGKDVAEFQNTNNDDNVDNTRYTNEIVNEFVEDDDDDDDGFVDEEPATKSKDSIRGLTFNLNSIMTKPSAQFGNKTTTTIHVSCGASSGDFPVVGRSIYEVSEFLREVLNVTRMSIGLVNGKEVDHNYIIQSHDNLEFLKPAGQKG